MDHHTVAQKLNSSGHSSKKRKRLPLTLGLSAEMDWTNFHPSILHLRVYAADLEIYFHRLKVHAMRAVIASVGVPFDHDQFAAFIWELYEKDTYRSLRVPAILMASQPILRHSERMTILSLIMSLTFEIIC